MSKKENNDKYMKAYLRHKKRYFLALLAVATLVVVMGNAVLLFAAAYEAISCTIKNSDFPTANCLSKAIDYLPGLLIFWGLFLFCIILITPLYFLSTAIVNKKNPALNALRNRPQQIVDCKTFPDKFPLFAGAGKGLSIILRPLGLLARKIIGQELYLLCLKVRTGEGEVNTMTIQLLKDDAMRFAGEFHGWTWFGS